MKTRPSYAGLEYLNLSYVVSESTPIPSGLGPVRIEHTHSMEEGEISNTFTFGMSNHSGTHIEGAMHFVQTGRPISDYPIEEFVFNSPLCVNVPKGSSELISADDLRPHADQISHCDLLLLRTGFSRFRDTDAETYVKRSPGLSAECAAYLRDEFDDLRAVGIDTISILSMQHFEDGIKAHRILLERPSPVFIIEDVNLSLPLDQMEQVVAAPLFVSGFDSCPCTVIVLVRR